MSYKGTLYKIKSTHQNVRTDSMEGETSAMPEIGRSFVIFGEALVGDGGRMIHTTPVTSIECTSMGIVFTTANSTYRFEMADKVSEFDRTLALLEIEEERGIKEKEE